MNYSWPEDYVACNFVQHGWRGSRQVMDTCSGVVVVVDGRNVGERWKLMMCVAAMMVLPVLRH